MVVVINPYKRYSKSAKSLRHFLTGLGVKTFVMNKEPKPGRMVINWGNSDFNYDPKKFIVVNPPSVLALMTNKLRFFNAYGHGDMVPEWTTSATVALGWKGRVVARTLLEGSGGAGIVMWEADKGEELPKAPLYVKYENKTHEYRLHMARGLSGVSQFHPLLIQRKIFQKSETMGAPKDWAIRNHDNGFIYVQNSGTPIPDAVVQTATDFMNRHWKEMHFAALDVIFHEKRGKAYILEGNTAPGLEGNTIRVYSEYFQTLANEARQ